MYSFDVAIRGYHYHRKYWQPDVNQKLYLTDERNTLFFLEEKFYKNKSLGFGKKIKNKLKTKPDLLSRRK